MSLEFQRVDRLLPSHLNSQQLNLLVFGPGKGEACLLVFPDGSLGVVDGCGEPNGGKSALREGQGDPVSDFIRALDASRAAAGESPVPIRFVCLTHPHDDHYAGLGRLLERHGDRIQEVWVTAPVSERYSEALLHWVDSSRAGRNFPMPDSQTEKGLRRVVEQVKAHRHHRAKAVVQLSENKHPLHETIEGHPLSVHACGPADGDVEQGLDELLQALHEKSKPSPSAERPSECRADPNRTSAALVIRWGQAGILLAGDLLNGQGPHGGWHRAEALHCLSSEAGAIQVLNVAHHASEEAHHEGLWTRLQSQLTIVTPFRQAVGPAGAMPEGGNPPRPARIRHLTRSSRVVITSPPSWNPSWADLPLPQDADLQQHFQTRAFFAEHGQTSLRANGGANARRNAVLVSLSATGDLLSGFLAGEADEYR